MNYQVGAARIEQKHDADGVAMMGFGDFTMRIEGAATPLYSRAIAIVDPKSNFRLVMVCIESCFVTEALRLELLARLKKEKLELNDAELIFSANHTHSAPGGFSSYAMYNVTNDGFIKRVFDAYLSSALDAVKAALGRVEPAQIRFASGMFPVHEPVAFNRSIRAWNRNPEVQKHSRRRRHLAVDREMQLLRFDRADGTPIAAWNWFPVHCTSIHRDYRKMHSDNKGIAATLMEEQIESSHSGEGKSPFVSVFSQGPAGDVSPNFKYYLGIRELRGADRSDEKSAIVNGTLQAIQALKLFEQAQYETPVSGELQGIFEYQDLSHLSIDPDLVDGKTDACTGPAEVGTPQLYGTAEGRGASYPMILAMIIVARVSQLYNFFADRIPLFRSASAGREKMPWPWKDHPVQGNKITILRSGKSEIFETSRFDKLIFPGWMHPIISNLKKWGKRGILKQRPFTPQILPIQLVRLGHIAIAAVPAEFTTVAGWRLRTLLEKSLTNEGVRRVIIQCYANAYSSYVTTPEEYEQQSYEGGCTHFGRWTLPAYLMLFRNLAEKLILKQPANSLRPIEPLPEFWDAITVK